MCERARLKSSGNGSAVIFSRFSLSQPGLLSIVSRNPTDQQKRNRYTAIRGAGMFPFTREVAPLCSAAAAASKQHAKEFKT